MFCFYLKQYDESHKLFVKSKNLKTINNQLCILEEMDPDKYTSDLFENKIYTDAEIDYNIALADLQLGNFQPAKKILGKYQSF